MVHIIGADRWRRPVFAEFAIDETAQRNLTILFERVISQSFDEDEIRRGAGRPVDRSEAEIKRRFNIAAEWFRVFAGDKHWSISRIKDELPKALRATLDGVDYTPSDRLVWAPGD